MSEVQADIEVPIPVTTEALKAFCDELLAEGGYPNKPGYRQMVGTMIMHESETAVTLSKKKYLNAIKKAQANEIAYWFIQDAVKEIKAEEERLKQEEATQPENGSDEAAS